MKTKEAQTKQGDKKDQNSQSGLLRQNDLKTDSPLSEKDEVKQAELRTNKPLRHHL
jgi:hypothetical protein